MVTNDVLFGKKLDMKLSLQLAVPPNQTNLDDITSSKIFCLALQTPLSLFRWDISVSRARIFATVLSSLRSNSKIFACKLKIRLQSCCWSVSGLLYECSHAEMCSPLPPPSAASPATIGAGLPPSAWLNAASSKDELASASPSERGCNLSQRSTIAAESAWPL